MGELTALLTALLWALGVILFKKSVAVIPPFAVSVFKNTVAFALLLATVFALGQTHTLSIPSNHLLLIAASGVIGIGISDTLFLMMLHRLGASRTALIDCLYSPFVILFSFALLGETLPVTALLGGVLIIGSVFLCSQSNFGGSISRRQFWIGCGLGVMSMATVACAIVLVQPLLNSYPLIWLSTIRMGGGIAVLLLLLPFHPDGRSAFDVFRRQRGRTWMFWGTFFGSYLSLVFWLAGFKYSQAGVVALLNQTSTVLIVIFAALFLKEPMTRLKLVAVTMAFFGAVVVLYSR
jgi:drug/metabolite transporter (DMT)-like permease